MLFFTWKPTILQTEIIDNVDVIFLQLKTRSKKIIIGLIYRPPVHNNNSDKKLFDQIIEVSNSFERVIFGDFNQHVNKPTRGDNILDLVFSTNDGLVSNVNTGPEFSTSDHKIIFFNINLEVYKDNVSEELIFMYRKGNFEKLRKLLADTDRSIVENETEVNKSWEKFYDILNGAVKLCIPVCKSRPRKNKNIN